MSDDEESRMIYHCKTCDDFVWGHDRLAHMMTAHYVYTKSAEDHFEEGVVVPPIVIPDDSKP